MKPGLLINMEAAEKPVHISGAGCLQFVAYDMGYLQDFSPIHASESMHANILSLADVEDIYPVTYIPTKLFIVHLPDHDIIFNRVGKHYVVDWSKMYNTFVTKGVYTKAEEHRAKLAYVLIQNSGYPLLVEAVHLIEDGNIVGLPA